ncbi:cytochrome P450 [Geopyxis carbonaria]|nr:cytochrome P450 [Geopyxis carbonaria]
MNTILTTLLLLLLLHTAHRAASTLVTHLRRRRLRRLAGVAPVPHYGSRLTLGIPHTLALIAADRSHRLPQFFAATFTRLGNTWAYAGPQRTCTMTIDPRLVHAVLGARFGDFGVGGFRAAAFAPLLGRGIFCVDGARWEESRALLRPLFKRGAELERLETHVQRLLRRVWAAPRGEAGRVEVEVGEMLLRFTMDAATEWLFGVSEDSLLEAADADVDTFRAAFPYAQDVVTLRAVVGPWMAWLLTGRGHKKFLRACKVCHDKVDGYVDIALERIAAQKHERESEDGDGDGRRGRYNFVDELVKVTQDREVLREQALGILFAARDSTALLLGWTLYELARHPSVFLKARSQVLNLLGSGATARPPRHADLQTLPYLRQILYEVLRLYPPVPLNGRTALRDVVLPCGGGPAGDAPILVCEGDALQYSVFSMHRRKDLYGEDAEAFRPERWGETGMGRGSGGGGYLPFNAGPRVCLGQRKALEEATYVLARLLQEVRGVGTVPGKGHAEGEDMEFKVTLTMSLVGGVWVALEKA